MRGLVWVVRRRVRRRVLAGVRRRCLTRALVGSISIGSFITLEVVTSLVDALGITSLTISSDHYIYDMVHIFFKVYSEVC